MSQVPFIFSLMGIAAFLTACGGGSSVTPTQTSVTPPPVVTPSGAVLPVPEAAPAGDDFHPSDKGWVSVWFDEFDCTELDRAPHPGRVWNKVPESIRPGLLDMALDIPELSPRELAIQFTDTKG